MEPQLSAHRCLPLTGCTICVTGLEERKRVSELCEENGGKYSSELTKGVCTHLLVGNTDSTKYKYARQWQTHCVTPQWMYDSIEAGYCMPENDYNVGESLYDERTVQTQPPKLLLSSLEQREKVDYGALIQELGGEYIELDYLTTECSHLVVGKASRTEKYLGGCAAGKWVLHKSYLEACRAAGEFVAEEEHEWGVSVGGREATPLESAPRKWRIRLMQASQDPGARVGAFRDWTVLLYTENNQLPGLKRLLETGGAHVLSNSKLTPDDVKNVTHAFINMNHFPKDTITLESLVRGGVHCLLPDYISEYLLTRDDVPARNVLWAFLLPEAKAMFRV